MRVTGETKLCALIGNPIEHSLSPAMHNAAFEYLELGYIYVAFRVSPKNLEAALTGAKAFGVRGLNLTMPLKTRVIEFLDEIDSTAQSMGAVNTLLNKEGRLIGYNTDGSGAIHALKANETDVTHKKIVILGAGGASRAIGYAFVEKADEIVFLNRSRNKAVAVALELNQIFGKKCRHGGLAEGILKRELQNADIMVNATSVGMHPHENETPVGQELLGPGLTVFDLVYDPVKTRLLMEANAAGARTIDGLSMLVHQGALSFEIWTGKKAPIGVMFNACIQALSEGAGRK